MYHYNADYSFFEQYPNLKIGEKYDSSPLKGLVIIDISEEKLKRIATKPDFKYYYSIIKEYYSIPLELMEIAIQINVQYAIQSIYKKDYNEELNHRNYVVEFLKPKICFHFQHPPIINYGIIKLPHCFVLNTFTKNYNQITLIHQIFLEHKHFSFKVEYLQITQTTHRIELQRINQYLVNLFQK